jgi:LDH2 family malate/lactate/ureidoglycolate dehydrogenase
MPQTKSSISVVNFNAWIAAAFRACGVPSKDAQLTAEALTTADVEGVGSHGVMLLPMYVERLQAGSVNSEPKFSIFEDYPSLTRLDADRALGQVSSTFAVQLATERAQKYGTSIIAVKNAFHFGAAAFWSRKIAESNMIGIAMSNTRPLMPAPGGAERVIGNNPVSFAFPSDDGQTLVVDMATSSSAMGKIRNAERRGEDIPEGWATDKNGRPTISATEAISGMLLPAAGPKGFGLAVAIDLLCGGLSGGAAPDEVKPLYGPPNQNYDCSHFFLAIAVETPFSRRVGALAERIRTSTKVEGTPKIYAPGDLEREHKAALNGSLEVELSLKEQLDKLAEKLGIPKLT